MEKVILVDKDNNQIGVEEKIKAHQEGKLHRAFSIFVFNSQGKVLLQRRAAHKYHSGGLWSNTCCSHPRPREDTKDAVHRRLQEEMGFDCELKEIFSFIYQAPLNNSLIEHEHDQIFIGNFDGKPNPNSEEADSWKWVDAQWLANDLKARPELYTAWLKACYAKVLQELDKSLS